MYLWFLVVNLFATNIVEESLDVIATYSSQGKQHISSIDFTKENI